MAPAHRRSDSGKHNREILYSSNKVYSDVLALLILYLQSYMYGGGGGGLFAVSLFDVCAGRLTTHREAPRTTVKQLVYSAAL